MELNTLKVYQGWPNVKTNLNLVEKFKIQENKLLIGNNKGQVNVYEIN